MNGGCGGNKQVHGFYWATADAPVKIGDVMDGGVLYERRWAIGWPRLGETRNTTDDAIPLVNCGCALLGNVAYYGHRVRLQ